MRHLQHFAIEQYPTLFYNINFMLFIILFNILSELASVNLLHIDIVRYAIDCSEDNTGNLQSQRFYYYNT